MDIRRLEIFLKLFETRSFSKAADSLNLTQPSVSASLKALEESLGQKLFERTPRSVKPLPSAFILAPYASDIIQTAGNAAWAINRQLPAGEMLRLGASSVPALIFLPNILADFSDNYPGISIKLQSGQSKKIIQKVADGEIDMALVGSQPQQEDLSHSVIGHDHLALLCSTSLAEKVNNIPESTADLAKWPLIIREEGSGTREALTQALANLKNKSEVKINIKAEVEGFMPAVAMAKASFGATVISSLTIPLINKEGLIAFDLKFLGKRSFYLIKKRSTQYSPAMGALSKMIKVTPKHSNK